VLAREAVARAHREEWGRIVATLIRLVGDFDLAEEGAQEAFTLALEKWEVEGVPENPRAWLVSTARHRALDRLRARRREDAHAAELTYVESLREAKTIDALAIEDDRLRLFFTCCHPALAPEAQVALTLRTLSGLTTEEIARAFLVPVVAMQQRLVRAKARIAEAQIPYEIPEPSELPERLPAVLTAIYLVFNEGYAASRGAELVRGDLCDEAIALGRVLAELAPSEGGVLGLLALMLLTHARRAARSTPEGELVLLDEQDRARWDRAMIDEGRALVRIALGRPVLTTYALQAAVAAVHADAARAEDTDWAQIATLYAWQMRLAPSPVVALNAAVAYALGASVEEGLARVDALAEELDAYGPFHAARADLLRRLERAAEATAAYERALQLAGSDPERRYLARRRDETAKRP
jgi:RNA polymerase sigma-70 factor (ECF subfamily)